MSSSKDHNKKLKFLNTYFILLVYIISITIIFFVMYSATDASSVDYSLCLVGLHDDFSNVSHCVYNYSMAERGVISVLHVSKNSIEVFNND